uniref:Nodule-specific cysteine-rich peptide L41 n=1 Tax=Lens culinaris TaxID=3864 RepID=A0A7T8DVD7_LENCU|nr:nodule-specific cysteine-rich peptide L41 [Lens culinaris]
MVRVLIFCYVLIIFFNPFWWNSPGYVEKKVKCEFDSDCEEKMSCIAECIDGICKWAYVGSFG